MQVLSPESLAIYPKRIGTNRAERLPAAGRLRLARQRPAGVQREPLRELRAIGQRTAGETIAERVILKLITQSEPPEKLKAPSHQRQGESTDSQTNRRKAGRTKLRPPACVQQGPNTFNGKPASSRSVVYQSAAPPR